MVVEYRGSTVESWLFRCRTTLAAILALADTPASSVDANAVGSTAAMVA